MDARGGIADQCALGHLDIDPPLRITGKVADAVEKFPGRRYDVAAPAVRG
jgi:hypothetical protein